MLGLGVGFYKLAGESGSTYRIIKPNSGSMNFNGVDESVQCDNIADDIWNSTAGGTASTTNFSASAWINIDTTSTTGMIFKAGASGDNNNQFNMMYHNGTQEIRCTIKAGGDLDQPSYPVGAGEAAEAAFEGDGNWHHVAMTVDSTADSGDGKITLYVDGTARDTNDNALGTFDATINECDIGQNLTNGSFFKGEIDEVAFWNRTLTAANITTLYNSGAQSGEKALDLASGTHVPKPFAWYRFDESSGTVAINSVDAEQNGTYINAPTISTSTP
tara:strand:- start:16 stop:837 length:822 start_codon:yes stop_codon:yes gene_type:complete